MQDFSPTPCTYEENACIVKVVRLDGGLPLPAYQTYGSAGADLHSAVDVTIEPHERQVIPTGIKVQIPHGHEMQIRPRSGLAAKYGITVINSPGTVDSDFRSEVGVILINHGNASFEIKRGDRIAQAVINKISQASFLEVERLDPTARNEGGFGSTGR